MANPENFYAPAELGRLRTLALGIGGIALIIWAAGAYFNTEQALRSWLLGFIFWGGISIGSLGVLMLQYLTGGAWGLVIRRIVEAGSRSLKVVALMFIPLAIGVYTHSFYEWTHLPPTDHAIEARGIYLLPWFWIVRSVIYFSLWGVMVYLLNKWGAAQDKTTTVEESRLLLERASRFSGPTMVIYALVVTFAVVDWVMTLDHHWYSTMWGFLYIAGWALSAFAFVIALLANLADKAPMNKILGKKHFHDIGKLMLALVMVWAYFNLSQFLIIYSGNLPEETPWYLARMKGAWGFIGIFLIVCHFAIPYLLLLSRDIKRNAKWLSLLAIFILLMRLVDMFYQIAPNSLHGEVEYSGIFHLSWMDFVGPIAVGGLWLWWFFGELKKRPLIPHQDPFIENAIKHGQGH